MKILYGVQGTGNGHITRARALSTELAKAGLEVDYIFSGRAPHDYFNMEPFGSYRTFTGLTFATRNGQVKYLKTAFTNNLPKIVKEIRSLQLDQYDLVLTDFEPISAWAAKLSNKPSIGIGHQYAFGYDIPVGGSNWISRFILKNFAPASITIGLHWHHFNSPILPPIVEAAAVTTDEIPRKILVYLPFEDLKQICHWLNAETDYDFYVYHHLKQVENRGHIRLQPFSRDNFQADLVNCEGVITNSGFVMSSEAIQYGKKILTKPLLGQMEQLSNAQALQLLERADVMTNLDRQVLKNWLLKKSCIPVRYPNVAREIVAWIKEGQKEPLHSLARRLWQACELHSANSVGNRDIALPAS